MRKLHLHEKRRITFAEYGALLGTREMLARGDLVHQQEHYACPTRHGFNMATQGDRAGCGTVSCIGGTMAFILGRHPISYVGMGGTLRNGAPEYHASCAFQDLFYPPGDASDDWAWITPKIAVKAIDNWLRTGKPGWAKLKPKKRKTR